MNKPAFFLLLVTTLGLTTLSATAEPVGNISTLRGKVYHRCEIIQVHPDGVSFVHAKGAAKILFTELAPEWRVKLGYNEAKAAAYQRELAEKRQREADARTARQAELGKALALAQQMELDRLRLAQQQATLMIQAAAAANNAGYYSGNYPVLPVLGAVWDGRSFRQQYRGGNGAWGNNGRWCQPGWGYPWGAFGNSGFCQPGVGVRACNVGVPGRFSFQITP